MSKEIIKTTDKYLVNADISEHSAASFGVLVLDKYDGITESSKSILSQITVQKEDTFTPRDAAMCGENRKIVIVECLKRNIVKGSRSSYYLTISGGNIVHVTTTSEFSNKNRDRMWLVRYWQEIGLIDESSWQKSFRGFIRDLVKENMILLKRDITMLEPKERIEALKAFLPYIK